jgi:predicted transcriptional regulator
MAPKKGVSFDDKRLRLLEIFSRAEVFTLKEIEKIGSKEKGIVEQTIKDVLQTLVDDGLVETDKIGAGNFYWALPSKAGNSRRSQISKLQGEIQLKAAATSELEKRKRESESLRGDSGRAAKIAEHAALASNIKRLREEISVFSTCDPEIFAKLQKDAKVAKAAADRWTDNLFLLQVISIQFFSRNSR